MRDDGTMVGDKAGQEGMTGDEEGDVPALEETTGEPERFVPKYRKKEER